jgi:PAS domain S-box-containing protein
MPAVVVVLVLAAVGYSAVERFATARQAATESARSAFKTPMIQLQAALSDHLPAGESDIAQRHVSMMAIDEHVRTLMVVDDIGIITFSNRALLEGSPADDVEGYSEDVARVAIDTYESHVVLSADGTTLHGYFPLDLGARPGALRPDRIGVLYADYSLAAELATSDREAYLAALRLGLFMLLLAGAQYLTLHVLITRRTGRLAAAMVAVANGDLGVRSQVSGPDEIGQLATAFDSMTEQLADQRARLTASENLHRLIADNAADWVFWIEPDGNFRYSSPSCEQMTGYRAEEFIDDPTLMERLIHPADRALYREHREHELLQGTPDLEFRIVRRDGAVRWIGHACQPIIGQDGTFQGSRGGNRDITELTDATEALRVSNRDLEVRVEDRTRQLADTNDELAAVNEELTSAVEELAALNEELAATNERLEDATRAAEAASKAKSDFIASMSHELRTPLNSIIGFSDILLSGMAGPLNDEELVQLKMINTSGRHLLELINEILDLSKIEVGRMDLHVEEFAPEALVRQAADTLSPDAVAKGLTLQVDTALCPATMRTDRLKLEQILINLLGNAVKFTDEGSVSVSVSCKGPLVTFTIADTGRGIPDAELDKVFGEFYQIAIPDEAKTTGTGLGLPLSQRLAYLIGGHISVKSEVGVGSTFTLRIPLRLVADPEGDERVEQQ